MPTSSVGKTYTMNIVVTDDVTGNSVQVPLTVNVVADPTPSPPYLLPVSDVQMVSGQSASLNLSAYVPTSVTATFAGNNSLRQKRYVYRGERR